MANFGQQGPNGYNGNNPLNYGVYNPNPQVGYNSNFIGGFEPNYHGAYNGCPPRKPFTEPIETEFMKFVESWFRNKFSTVENILLAVKNIIATVEITHTALTNIFNLSLDMMENTDKYKMIFNYIWKSLNLYKLFRWLYVKFLNLLGCPVAIHEDEDTIDNAAMPATKGVPYRMLAFLGVIISAPYFIARLLESLYEDPMDPVHWRSSGYLVKVIQDFDGSNPNEMSVRINDKLIVAPKCYQSEMNLDNSEFVFATGNGCSGLVPIKHLMIEQPEQTQTIVVKDATGNLQGQVDKPTDVNVYN